MLIRTNCGRQRWLRRREVARRSPLGAHGAVVSPRGFPRDLSCTRVSASRPRTTEITMQQTIARLYGLAIDVVLIGSFALSTGMLGGFRSMI